jgi:hypothetical protein
MHKNHLANNRKRAERRKRITNNLNFVVKNINADKENEGEYPQILVWCKQNLKECVKNVKINTSRI